ncbi:MAG: hypothetical protein GYB66_01115 [Chloroflexi bacterium]|nr:hypothetical protein [Chloroflexota bacterium]
MSVPLRRTLLIISGLILALSIALALPSSSNVSAQDAAEVSVYTWRDAAMTLQYPAEWAVGSYAGNPLLATSGTALDNAGQGLAPGEPAITLLFYPQVKDQTPSELLETVFPNLEAPASEYELGAGAVRAEFADENTGQRFVAIAFISPATRDTQLLVAAAPTEMWADFEPSMERILDSVAFLSDTAELSFFDTSVVFEYDDAWQLQGDGQVVVVGNTSMTAERVLDGDFTDVGPFVRSQVLIPSGIGIEPEDPEAATNVLLRFLGIPAENIEVLQVFEWAEGMPAASAWFEFSGLRMVMVAVVNGDTAMLIGGGAPIDQWANASAQILGALNLTRFAETPPVDNLTAIVTGEVIASDRSRVFGALVQE